MSRYRLRELLNLAIARATVDLDTPLIQFLTDDEKQEKTQIQTSLKAEDQ